MKKKVTTFQRESSENMWADPVVRVLGLVIVVIIIGALLTVISMLVTGLLPSMFAPQTSVEADIEQYRVAVDEEQDPDAWSKLIIALGRRGKINEARSQLEAFRASDPDVTRTQAVAYAEAHLLIAEERYDEALVMLEDVRRELLQAYETELASKKDQNWAIAMGIPENYLLATLDKANIFYDRGQYEDAIAMLDDYIERVRVPEGSAYIRRANVKMSMNDLDGAEKDFLEAQRYLPDDEEIRKGLEEIRAAR